VVKRPWQHVSERYRVLPRIGYVVRSRFPVAENRRAGLV